ncbi:tagaturonate reductase [Maribacter sp. 2210JD10-5]|uniref:tagaturonate reductase n=1 Tax=Maribacter sp. 2210JD10-5 TaxID=3386272 RepID=UPI0039BC701F
MKNLNRNTANKSKTLPIRVMQFGGGNFLRAFVDWMIQVLNEETDFNAGVAIIKPTERGDYKELKNQDGLFTVVLDGIKKGELIAEKKLVSCVQEIFHAYNEWDSYLALAQNPDVRFVVSNTTEAGIKFNPNDRIDANPPKEFPAKLTIWLNHRFNYFKGAIAKGCIVLPCELIEDNGSVLKNNILKYADHFGFSEAFKEWIETANHFCSTLVDRIVSGYPTDRAEEIVSNLGYTDDLLVAGEYYHSWVIQADAQVQKELPFARTDLNVEFVDDLTPYREMKVRVLNGAHTAMVPVAYLAGIRLVKEAMADDVVSNFVASLLLEETAKTLDFSEKIKNQFVADVLDRFRNPLLKHQLISISLNSTSKFVARLLPTLKDYLNSQGKLPKRIVFGLSALILFYRGEFNGEKIDLKDDQNVLDFFSSTYKKLIANEIQLKQMLQMVLSNTVIWKEDLTKLDGLAEAVLENIETIHENGIKNAIKTLK